MSYGNIPIINTPYEFKVMYIPVDGDNRPGIKADKNSFTVHNTDNYVPDENEAKNLGRVDNFSEVGFHFVNDENSVTATIPDDEIAYHCGNKYGNYHSVSLEVANRPGAEEVAIEFIADYFIVHNWGIDILTNHKYWNGKNCPSWILQHWDKFIAKILKTIQAKKDLMEAKKVLDKVVIYLGDADVFGAIMVSQFHHCSLWKKSDWDISGQKAKEIIQIGGKPNSDRFSTFKDAANML